jgi:hypothetical protein
MCHFLKNDPDSTPGGMAPIDTKPPPIGSDKFVMLGFEHANAAPDSAHSRIIRRGCGQAVNAVSQVPRLERSICDVWLIL